MSATFELYSRWKNAKGHKSDRQGAIALGVSPQTVQFWKDGRNGQPDIIEKMARDLDEDPIKTILAAYAEKETGNSKKVLVKLSKRFGAVVLAAQLGAAAYPVEATNNGAELYIMRSKGWIDTPRQRIMLTASRRQVIASHWGFWPSICAGGPYGR